MLLKYTSISGIFSGSGGAVAQQTILVIEDEITWRELLGRILGEAGYDVHVAATCAEGVKLADLHKPDCIISDFHLSDGDAISVCTAVKSNESIKKTPIIIFSSDPEAETAALCGSRADNFVLKGPEAWAELPAAIERILRPVFSEQSDG